MISIFCLHGFLGSPSDWDTVFTPQANDSCIRLEGVPTHLGLDQSAKWVNTTHQGNTPSLLIGYSLGGRIALHALLQEPSRWKAAVIISAHPGLSDLVQRKRRFKEDLKWAARFESESLQLVLEDWNQQPVFQGSKSLVRMNQKSFLGSFLGQTLTRCSLGIQRDLHFDLSSLKIPILWVSGEYDKKYQNIHEQVVMMNVLFHKVVIPGAGHRVILDQPLIFREKITRFLQDQVLTGGPGV